MALTAVIASIVGLTACGGSSGSGSGSGGQKVAAHCTPAHHFKTISKGTITVVGEPAMPFGTINGSTETGIDGDVVNAIAKMECLTVTAHPVDSSGVIPGVQYGKADIGIGGWYRNPARLKVITMSNGVYNDENAFISKTGVDTFPPLKSLQVGAPGGYNFDPGVQQYLGGKLRLYQNSTQMYEDLRIGRLDVGMDSYTIATYRVKQGTLPHFKVEVPRNVPKIGELPSLFAPTQVGLPVYAHDTGFLQAVNADIAVLARNGQLLKIASTYGMPASSLINAHAS